MDFHSDSVQRVFNLCRYLGSGYPQRRCAPFRLPPAPPAIQERSQRCDTDVTAGGAAAVWQAKRKKRCYQSLKGISHNCSGIFFDTQMSFGGLGKTLTVRKTIAFDSPGMKRALRWLQCGKHPAGPSLGGHLTGGGRHRAPREAHTRRREEPPVTFCHRHPEKWLLDVGRSQPPLAPPRGSVGGADAATSAAAGTPGPKTINKRTSLSEPGVGMGLCDFWKPHKKLCVTAGIKIPFALHARPGATRQLLLSTLLGGYLLCS